MRNPFVLDNDVLIEDDDDDCRFVDDDDDDDLPAAFSQEKGNDQSNLKLYFNFGLLIFLVR